MRQMECAYCLRPTQFRENSAICPCCEQRYAIPTWKMEANMTKSDNDKTETSKAEQKKAKPTAQQMGKALHDALVGMVAHAEAAGQRDMPHVCAARAALEMTEPEKKPEDD